VLAALPGDCDRDRAMRLLAVAEAAYMAEWRKRSIDKE